MSSVLSNFCQLSFFFFFFNDTPTTEISTLPLHDALPISERARRRRRPALPGRLRTADRPRRQADRRQWPADPGRELGQRPRPELVPAGGGARPAGRRRDRESTRLYSRHPVITDAVFCL